MIRRKRSAITLGVLILALSGLANPVQAGLVVGKKLVSPASGLAHVGELVNFQISISNNDRAQSIVSLAVADTYSSAMLEFVSAEPAPSSIVPGQGYLNWSDLTQALGDLGPGRMCVISVTFRAIAPTTVAPASNTASVTGFDSAGAQQSPPAVSAIVDIAPPSVPDPYEPNNQLNQGKTINLNEPISAYISPVGDVDYFFVSLSTPGTYYVRLYDLPADYDLYLLNAQGVEIGRSLNKGTLAESIQFAVKTAGRWVIKVVGNQSFFDSRPYKLAVTQVLFTGGVDSGGQAAPGGTFVLQGLGLPPGAPASPNLVRLYLDTVTSANLLKTVPVLPNGQLGAGLRMPAGITVGQHDVVARIVNGNSLIGEFHNNVGVAIPLGSMELWVDDAWARDPDMKMPVVNKLVPTYTNSIGRTKVDINCRFTPLRFSGTLVKFRIHVKNDAFGPPDAAYVRKGFAGALTSIAFVNEGGGYYSAVVNSSDLGSQHCVFRFRIPVGLATPDTIDITGDTRYAADNTVLRSITQARHIALARGFSATIFLNRATLFRDMNDAEVADLLAQLYIHSQDDGLFGPHDRRAQIYPVDTYTGSTVANWNNSTVDYSTEFNANSVARAIWLLMQEVMLQYSSPAPFYVMIVGNDEQFPLYRMKDPSNSEKDWLTTTGSNPTMMATENNCVLTDNFYGYFLHRIVDGLWYEGNMDLVVGRIIGDGALDMKELFLNGITHTGDTSRAVMASVDGWELGYEPDDNRAGEVKDHLNVPGRLAARGFGVYNDGESPRTIDKMSPYPSNWASGFQSAANAGMDLFFIGGHNDYRFAGLPGDDFDPSDIPGKYTRFDDDNPIVMIVGCHGGLPVPAIGSWPGGANNSMVYSVIHRGARAYYGASGFSYGSPGNLHACLWGELLLQYNFDIFTQYLTNSTTLGYAVRQGKIDFPFGIGGNYGLDVKTVTEFNLFGLPWQRLAYPGSGNQQKVGGRVQLKPDAAPGKVRERALLLEPRKITQLAPTTYQQSFHIHTDSATPGKLGGFDIINIPGGEQQYVVDAPLLPAITPHSIALPSGGKILSVSVNNPTTTTLGKFEIPTSVIGPWTVSGITLSATTTINYLYPRPSAELRAGGQNQYLLTVFPVRHNPTTNDTVLNGDFDVTVNYEAPVPYGILNFATGSAVYGPGTLANFSADVFNMGSSGLALSADLAIWNDDTNAGVTTQTMALDLGAGAVYPLLASGTAPLEPGRYGARLRVWDAVNGVANTAAATTEFEVKSVLLSNLSAAYSLSTGKVALSVRAANLGDTSGTLAPAFAIRDSADLPLDNVLPAPVILGPGAQMNVQASWSALGVTNATCLVEAVATFEGAPTNSVQSTFTPFTTQSMLDAILAHLLGIKQLNQSERVIADMNHDGTINVADLVLAVNEANKQP